MVFDVIINGGGMVGAALACALTERTVALIDASFSEEKTDTRLIALNYRSIEFFKKINLWEPLSPRAEMIHAVHVSQQGRLGSTCIQADELKLPFLGAVVPAQHITEALYQRLSTQKNVTTFRPAVLQHFSQEKERVIVSFSFEHKDNQLEGAYLIGADGSHSTVRDLLNIPTEKINYGQSALVTQTELQRSHHGIAYERFQKDGAIAMLPLSENRVATIVTGKTEEIAALMDLNEEAFLRYLQKHFGYRLGKLKKTAARSIYPLHFIQTEKQEEGRVILMGNAAHTLHPIAAQGLNIALDEVNFLADALNTSLNQGKETLLPTSPRRVRFSHHLAMFFSADFFPLTLARQVGMVGLDMAGFLKKRLFLRIIS